jgi:hypothetical protein
MPGTIVKEFDLAAYLPTGSNAIVGLIGTASKGPIDSLNQFTDEGNFVNFHGRPVDGQHGMRAALRYLRYGNQLNYVRIAGTLLSTAYVEQWKEVSGTDIPLIRFSAASDGSWANDEVKVNITLNGSPVSSFNVFVLFQNTQVERFDNLTNSNVETVINNSSNYIRVALHPDAGTTLPDSTYDDTIEQLLPLVLSGGNDGAFASTKSSDSSTGGLAAQNTWSYIIPFATGATYTRTEGRVIAPGSLVINDSTETFTDNGDGTLTGDATGTGVVNYQTGEWTVVFNAAPTTNITVAYDAGVYESVGTSLGLAADTGTAAGYGVDPDSLVIHAPREDQVDEGDGATAVVSQTLALKIVPGSIEITTADVLGNPMTVTDDGNGVITGDVAAPGTINYATGVLAFTFNANVKNLEPVMGTYKQVIEDDGSGGLSGDNAVGTINYQTGAWALTFTLTPAGDYIPGLELNGVYYGMYKHTMVLGFGDAVEDEFTGTLRYYPVKPGSVSVTYGVSLTMSDDGLGNLTGPSATGTVNYQTGEIAITCTAIPPSGFAVRAYADAIILDATSILDGPIGNERSPIADGIFAWVDISPNSPAATPYVQWYRFRVMFNDGSGSVAVETFDSLRTVQSMIDTVNDAENGSEYVRLEVTGAPGEADITYDSGNGQKLGMAGAYTMADVIGAQVGPNFTGLQLFTNAEAVPLHFLSAPGMPHRQIQQEGITISELRNLVWIYSIPDFDHTYDARDFVNGEYNAATPGGTAVPTAKVPYPPLSTVNTSYAFCSFSAIRYFDQYADAEVYEPGEGDVLALIAQVDQKFESWYPISGLRRGQVTNVSDLRYSPTEGERLNTYDAVGSRIEVINSFVKFIGQGIFLWGQRTMSREATSTDRLHVRWTANIIAEALAVTGRQFVFELNDEILWREITVSADRILNPIALKRGIVDYRIVCDATTNTSDVIANEKKAICKLFIKWTEVAEWIEYQLIYTPLGVSFSEVAPLG